MIYNIRMRYTQNILRVYKIGNHYMRFTIFSVFSILYIYLWEIPYEFRMYGYHMLSVIPFPSLQKKFFRHLFVLSQMNFSE